MQQIASYLGKVVAHKIGQKKNQFILLENQDRSQLLEERLNDYVYNGNNSFSEDEEEPPLNALEEFKYLRLFN